MNLFKRTLDRAAENGRPIVFWLRDDDATEPTPPLDRLLGLAADHGVPVTLAVVPAGAGERLAARIGSAGHATVAVHGWAHQNHAPQTQKKQELGRHRDRDEVLAEIGQGRLRIQQLFGERAFSMLVPPWNRIDESLLPALPQLGFRALSTFGAERRSAPLALLNTHVDIMDWRGTRGGKPADVLFEETARRIEALAGHRLDTVGILTHHLVHDEAAWRFIEMLFTLTCEHPGCRWMRSEDIVGREAQP